MSEKQSKNEYTEPNIHNKLLDELTALAEKDLNDFKSVMEGLPIEYKLKAMEKAYLKLHISKGMQLFIQERRLKKDAENWRKAAEKAQIR